MACILTLLFWVTKSAMVKSRDHATLFFPGRVKGAGPGVWGILVPRALRFLVTWSLQMKPRMGSGTENRFYVFEFISSLGSHAGVSHNYNLTLLRDMNFFIALFKLKYSATGGLNRHKTGQVCLNIYIFVLFFSLLLHRLAVRKDQFAVLYFVQVIIVLIQVYNWEIRHHSTVCRCVLAGIL